MNSGPTAALAAAPLRLTGFSRKLITSGVNSFINSAQLLVTGGSYNANFVATSKNGGSFIFGPAPDGTVIGGNQRGTNAVDLQIQRDNSTRVASGANSIVLGGGRNTASGAYSCGGGFNSTASGAQSFAYSGTASADNSAAFSGTASATNSISFNGLSYRRGMLSAGSFRLSAWATVWCNARLTNLTTNNTPTELLLRDDGAAERFVIQSGKIGFYLVRILGIKSDGSAASEYLRSVGIKNVAGTTSLVGSVVTIGTDYEDNPATDVTITADDTNDSLKIEVTGVTGETWRWLAVVDGSELSYGT